MSETSGGSYPKQPVTWARASAESINLLTGERKLFRPDATGSMVEVHDCQRPDADDFDGWEWACQVCGAVFDKHAEFWWEPHDA